MMSPCKCGGCAINETLLAASSGDTVHSHVQCFVIGEPLYPLMLALANLQAHPTWTFAESMREWPASGNMHRLRVLERHVCLRCGQGRGKGADCTCPRMHQGEP